MKKSKTMRAASFLLVLTLMTSCFVGSTFAKYTSTGSGEDTARVAKWDIQLEGAAMTETFTFNLFDYTDTNVDVNGSGSEKVIAPGTQGSFTIDLQNKSEVTAQYTIDYTVTNNSNIPVEYSIDNGTTWTKDLGDVTTPVTLSMDASTPTEVNVQWRWAFTGGTSTNFTSSQTDTSDTSLGKVGTATITVQAKITVDQVN